MGYVRVETVCLRRTRFSESSLIVVLFSRELGRIEALAKGCRRDKSPMRGRLDLFNHEETMIYERHRSGLDLVTECDAIEEFPRLCRNACAFSAACILGEIILHGCMARDPHPAAFDLLVRSLSRLDEGDAAESVLLTHLFGLMTELGFRPMLDGCAACGEELPEGRRLTLSGRRGGLVCPACSPRAGGRELPVRGVSALRYLTDASEAGRGRLNLPTGESVVLLEAAVRYAADALEHEIRGAGVLFNLLGRRRVA